MSQHVNIGEIVYGKWYLAYVGSYYLILDFESDNGQVSVWRLYLTSIYLKNRMFSV